MRSLMTGLLFMPLLLAGSAAHGQIYTCKDASGRTLTADRPIPECSDRVTRVLDRRGIQRGEIKPPPTAEEKRQMELQEEKRKTEETAAAEQRKTDRALRMRYSNEREIELDRERSTQIVQEQIKREKASLAAAETQLQQAQAEAEPYKKKNAATPAALQRRLDESQQTVKDLQKTIQIRVEEAAQLNAKFDATLKRYREISVAAK
jgi:hypothetical protein